VGRYDQRVDSLIEQLLVEPPECEAEVRATLDADMIEAVREGLVERIVEGAVAEHRAATAAHVLCALGTAGHRQRLVQVVQSPFADGTEARRRARLAAFATLALEEEDREPRELAEELGLDSDEASEMAFRVFEATLDFDEYGVGLVEAYARALLEEMPGEREPLFRELDRRRERSGMEAGLLYRPLLEDDTYRPLWRVLIDAVASDGNPRDARWLQNRADAIEDEDMAGQLRRAAMKLRTDALDKEPSPIEGLAWIGNCDGSGEVTLFLFVDRDGLDEYVGLNAIVDLGARQLVDGFHATVHPAELGGFRDDIERDGLVQLADVPPEVAVGLLQTTISGGDASGAELRGDLDLVRRQIERFPDLTHEVPDIEPADAIDPEVLEILRVAPMFESWLFSVHQLRDAGVQTSDLTMPPDRWTREALSTLSDQPDIVRRVARMCEHMAVWAHYGAESGYDRQFAGLAAQVRDDFESAPIAEIMVRRTWQMVTHRESSEASRLIDELGDEALRARLARRHLSDEEDVSIQDEAIDYMELAYRGLEAGLEELPGHDALEDDLVEEMAGTVGRPLADLFCGRSELPPAATFEHVAGKLEAAGFDRQELEVLVPSLLTHADLLADRRGDAGFGPMR
jgi:hypothetical protein